MQKSHPKKIKSFKFRSKILKVCRCLLFSYIFFIFLGNHMMPTIAVYCALQTTIVIAAGWLVIEWPSWLIAGYCISVVPMAFCFRLCHDDLFRINSAICIGVYVLFSNQFCAKPWVDDYVHS